MARELQDATPQLRIMFALYKSRQFRHHRHCQCAAVEGQGCTAADAMWRRAMDRELESISRT